MEASEFNKKSIPNIIAAWAGLFTGPNGMIAATTSFFILPWTVEFHFNRSEVSLVTSIATIVIALCVPFAGRLMERYGLRRVLIPGVLCFAAMQFAITSAHAAWQLIILFTMLSIAGSIQTTVGPAKLISLWFHKNRGVVLGSCVALGASLGATLMPQLVNYLMTNYNWRVAYWGQGAVILVVGFPLMAFLMREPHDRHEEKRKPQIGLTRAEAMRTPAFWLLFFAIFLGSASLLGTISHAKPLLVEHGFSASRAAWAISFIFLGNMAGQFTLGAVADRFNTPRIAPPYFMISWVGLMIFHSATNALWLRGSAITLGFGLGAETAMAAYFCSRYFGLKNFSSIYALFFAASNLGIFTGINVMGIVHDLAGSYAPMRYVFAVSMGLAVVLISCLGPYVYARRQELEAA